MNALLNQYTGKISWFQPLQAPEGLGQGGGGDSGAGAGDDSQDDSGDDNGDESGDESGDDEGDDGLAGVFGNEELSDDEVFSFEDDSSGYVETDEDKAAATAVGDGIRAKLESLSFDQKLIPDDFDPTDKASLAGLLTGVQQQTISQTIQMIVPVITHALNTQSKHLRHDMKQTASGSSLRAKASQAFDSLGLQGKENRNLGKSLFQRAMQSNSNDVTKALKATRASLRNLGVNVGDSASPRSGGGNKSGNSTRSGSDALDSLFGRVKKK